jgi:hypothetical protein
MRINPSVKRIAEPFERKQCPQTGGYVATNYRGCQGCDGCKRLRQRDAALKTLENREEK